MNETLINIGLAATQFLFTFALGFYLITCLQWFSYKFERVLFHFTRPLWHVFFLIVPIVLFYGAERFFWIYFYFALVPSLALWYKKLDKKLVFTPRVKRFFVILALAVIASYAVYIATQYRVNLGVVLPLVLSFAISFLLEKAKFKAYENSARKKLASIPELKIIMITASFGKTSIKNFLFELLKNDFVCRKTPRSVNTLAGLIQDVNNELAVGTQIYIAEAGARLKGDIAQITEFLSPHIAIVGEIGAQHIEYFKTLENIRATKLEALGSKRLEKAFVHSSTQANEGEKIEIYDKDLSGVEASLDGVKFKLGEREFASPLLGKFNAVNLAVCVKTALYLGLDEARIVSALSRLKNVEHRLERIDAGGKIIIDDGFNGNFNGMSASYELVASYEGRKVLVTPGIMESSDEENEKLSKIINKTFDIVMLTSSLNAVALLKHLSRPKVIVIKDKSKMQEALAQNTRAGDLILFSNDAPSFM
ncbi:UDP-N-acetylmuramoyl-tripeptide--D-alanyl-D-alanine ligase [uncultured Campylobacter sp.]|uniref:Mur ligase family protein n=1 Tax=uncultured Campylobacter sp. TaxID=218934 RepID=UPI002615F4C8|nr:UDP-N-acetylmuramoyl-tripeptide--D-alanyl-D-alanine ligase [uncultured Campylobacter sp.]